MSLLDDEDILIGNVRETSFADGIKSLFNQFDQRLVIEQLLNDKYTYNDNFHWVYIAWGGCFSLMSKSKLVTSRCMCDLEMDRQGRLCLRFHLLILNAYFGNKEKTDNFIKEILNMFGDCMEEIYNKYGFEIVYGY